MLWSQFSAIFDIFGRKNWRFSQKPMLWRIVLHNLALFWVKNANFFSEFFALNIFKTITSVTGVVLTFYLPSFSIYSFVSITFKTVCKSLQKSRTASLSGKELYVVLRFQRFFSTTYVLRKTFRFSFKSNGKRTFYWQSAFFLMLLVPKTLWYSMPLNEIVFFLKMDIPDVRRVARW
jgi:hypothetical protein